MSSLPYISAAGNLDKAISGIRAAGVPARVSQDFVKTILKIPGGSGDQMTTYLKKLGLAGSDGVPTQAYTKLRNPTTFGQTMAECIRHTYARLYVHNEYMHDLSDKDLHGLIVEETGQPHDSLAVKRTLSCINALKKYAIFDEVFEASVEPSDVGEKQTSQEFPPKPWDGSSSNKQTSVGLNLGYTINLNLPATDNPAVFNAIFKSLKEHLLSDDDA